MKHMFDYLTNCKGVAMRLFVLAFTAMSVVTLWAEGSKDFANYGGYRLFLDNRNQQQLKVYAKLGETINVGASHVGISGGFIKVYRPDGVLAATFDGSGGGNTAIIFDNLQEEAGPVGGTHGYVPGTVAVQSGEEGVWTVVIAFPTYQASNFQNLLNGAPWNRADHQPVIPTVITAWDITISEGGAANEGGTMKSGRVYSNEYVSVISQNGFMTSPEFFVLTKGGYLYEVKFMETDPYRFPITSVSRGIVDGNAEPTYSSHLRQDVSRSADPLAWVIGQNYYYEPQAADYEPANLINNKIFFNHPDQTMPASALVTDIFRNNTHTTWLFNMPSPLEPELTNFELRATNTSGEPCLPGALEVGEGAWTRFESSHGGVAYLSFDLNYDGDYEDSVDVTIAKDIVPGPDSIYWDGRDGYGNFLSPTTNFTFGYKLELRDGETHILLSDVENNAGGVLIKLISNVKASSFDQFFYNHLEVGGPLSGGGAPNGQPMPTNVPFIYQNNFGENKILDYWAFVNYSGAGFGTFTVDITPNCHVAIIPDSDGDGIRDHQDLDDDNDGVSDKKEYCNPTGGFACLPGGRDPSDDADGDGVQNYKDANDPALPNNCTDANGDGVCDFLNPIFDTDGDKVPDHLDLDSDNDCISDLFEAGHNQPDVDGNGVIDGAPAIFGLNGLYNPIASHPDNFNAVEIYQRFEWDSDGVPDYDDLDSDNDGINDVAEAGYGIFDTNNDGRIGGGAISPAVVGATGLSTLIDPLVTTLPIPLPPDSDGDGIRNWHDHDSDNDLIHDVEEGNNPDDDNNAVIGTGVAVVDVNGKAIADANGQTLSTTSYPLNKDGDSRPDYLDLDADNDGINDVAEAFAGTGSGIDLDNNGMPGNGLPPVNTRGIPTILNNPATSLPTDTDLDGVRDYRDLDTDNDGINDVAEATHPDGDGDGIIGSGVPVVDATGRATTDPQGSTLTTTSAPQNTDGDVLADFRDLDTDNDGIWDLTEAASGANSFADPDHNGILGNGNPTVNANGQAAAPVLPTSAPTNTDAHGEADFRDLDSDNDGIVDVDECPFDAPCTDGDSDGTPDFRDFDRDNDGIEDAYECENSTPCSDTDNDGIADVDDLDTDDDGLTDAEECSGGNPCPDDDANGIPNWREYTCHAGTAVAIIDNLDSSLIVCEGQTVNLTANSNVLLPGILTYNWVGPNNFSFAGTATASGPFPVALGNVTFDDAGTYELTVFTDRGCPSQPVTTNIEVITPLITPSISVSDPQPCSGDEVMLTTTAQTGPFVEYLWYFGNNLLTTTTTPSFQLDDVSVSNSGNYMVIVRKGICESLPSNAATIFVTNIQNITPSLGADEPALCEGEVLSLSATGVPVGANFEWFFNDGNTVTSLGTTADPELIITDVTPSNSGNYSVVASAGGCISPPSNVEVVVVGGLLNQAPVLVADDDTPCEGAPLQLSTTAYPGLSVTYQWMFNDGNGAVSLGTTTSPTFELNNVNSSNSGDYLVVAGTTGCPPQSSNIANVVVNPMSVQTPTIAVNTDVLCQTEAIAFTTQPAGSGATYEWYFNGSLVNTTSTPEFSISSATAANTGNYTVAVVADGCTSPQSAPQAVTVNTVLSQTPVLLANASNLCLGETLELTSTDISGATYEWFIDAGNGPVSLGTTQSPVFTISDANAANSGTYTVQASISGCVSVPSNGQAIQVLNQMGTAPDLTASSNVLCLGETLLLVTQALGPNVQYFWYLNGNLLSTTSDPKLELTDITSANEGTYTVVANNGNCMTPASNGQSVDVNSVSGVAPNLSASTSVLCEGESLTLSTAAQPGNLQYLWYLNGSLINTTAVPTLQLTDLTPANAGTYTVVASNGNCLTPVSNGQSVVVNTNIGPAPSLTVVDDVLCEGETLELNSSIFPSNNVSYNWYFDNGSSTTLLGTTNLPTFFIQNMAANNEGIYTVTVSVGNCETQPSNAQDIYVTNALSGAPSLTASASQICEGETLALNSSIYPGTNVLYQWYFNSGGGSTLLGTTDLPTFFIQNMNLANEGTYTVVIASGNCTTQPSNAQAVDVTNALTGTPTLTASASQVCEGETLTLNSSTLVVSNASYHWYFDDGSGPVLLATTSVPTYFIGNATAANAGAYSVVVASGNCSTQPSNTQQVAVSNMIGQALQLGVSDNQLCEGETLTLNSSTLALQNTSYQWYFDNGSGPLLLATTAVPTYFINNMASANMGTYSVIATNGNCATLPSNLEFVQLTQAPALIAEASTDAANPACRGDLVQLNVTPVTGATYQWNGPQGFTANVPNPILPAATTGQAGDYTATLTIDGCSFTPAPATVHVFTGIAAADDVFDVNFNETLTDGVLVFNDQPGNVQNWDITIVEEPTNGTAKVVNGQLEYTPRQNYYGPDVLVYEICNTDCPDDCDRATVRLNVLGSNVDRPCFVPNIITPNGDGRNDVFEVPCLETAHTNNNVRIFNRWGDKVFEQDGYRNDWDGRFKGNLLPPGTYFYLIQLEKGSSDECLQGYFTITR